jgi:hypothetical protein
MTELFAIEKQVWDLRQVAFKRWKEGAHNDYERGLKWGILAMLDNVLSVFREGIDGKSGSGVEQMQAQRRRVGAK